MISYGANIDSIDFTGYTSLHLSIINNNFDIFFILLLYGASPFIHDNFNCKPIDYCNDYKYIDLLKKSTILHIGKLFGKVKFFFEDLQKKISLVIENDYKHLLQKDCAQMVTDVFNKCKNRNVVL